VPADLRTSLISKQSVTWPRLSEPRQLIGSQIEQHGWKFTNPDSVPYDLWAAGELPEMTLADQLTVLLIGFNLTFELHADARSIKTVQLKNVGTSITDRAVVKRIPTPPVTAATKRGDKQVFTLRVQEKPVRAVLQELQKRLHWAIQIEEEPIRVAGLSLDTRVSFSVENADQERLLEALLRPAGLDFRVEEDRIRIFPERYADK
jgi:hypothetical protein